nr:toxin HicA [Mycobacterium marinum]
MRENATRVDYQDLLMVCVEYFGVGRQRGSHLIFKMPWPSDPRVNIQPGRDGRAKPYQVKQVLAAIEKLEALRGERK